MEKNKELQVCRDFLNKQKPKSTDSQNENAHTKPQDTNSQDTKPQSNKGFMREPQKTSNALLSYLF